MMSRRIIAGGGALLLLALSGCPECAPSAVGEGVARLAVRDVGGMLTLLNDDARCGFASEDVLAGGVVEGQPGSEGSVTWTVNDCTIDLGDGQRIGEDCNGVVTRGRGRVTLSATRTVEGTLTGDPRNPVVPSGPDAVTIRITEARFTNFDVTRSNDERHVRLVSGSLSATAKPRLAASASSGACAIATPNVTFSRIRFADNTKVRVFTESDDFEVDVRGSNLAAQSGRRGDDENTISGSINVFDSDIDLLQDTELDDLYERNELAESYACLEDISDPVSFQCVDLPTQLGGGAARLAIGALGAATGLVDQNTTCGFSSTTAAGTAAITGTPGGEGTLTLTLTDCVLDLGTERDPTILPADCAGESRTLSGRVVVSGTKVIRGLLTGDPTAPIIPASSQPAVFNLDMDVNGLRFGGTGDDNELLIESGSLSGSVRPRVFVSNETGVCTVSTPNADFSNVRLAGAQVVVTSAAGSFPIAIEDTRLEATSGVTASGQNRLLGTVTIAGEDIDLSGDERGLDPRFDEDTFASTWQCNPELAQPVTDRCEEAAQDLLAHGVAALTMRNLGVLTRVVDADAACGFSSAGVAGGASTTTSGDLVTATLTLPAGGCTLSFPEATTVFTDCLGHTTTIAGTIVVTGTKTITGVATADPLAPILPVSTDAVRYDLDFTFTEASITTNAAPDALVVHDGSLSAVLLPRLALDPATQTCTIHTPIIAFSDVRWSNADVTLVTEVAGEPASARLSIEASDLDAQAGPGLEATNTLRGTIGVLGDPMTLSGPLDPGFQAQAFSSTWNCAANGSPLLVEDAQCRVESGG
jgi:hypothetical protein